MYLMDDPLAVSMERSWDELAAVVCDMPGERLVYVVGACNRGKTTFCRSLYRRLRSTERVAYIDCYPGQSSIGPPTTIGMQGMTGPGEPGGAVLRYFIGSTSPRGHLLPCLSGTAKLVEKARRLGFEVLVLDSSGFVLTDAAREFQFHVIDLLQPDFLVAFQHGSELESLLAGFDGHPGISIRHMPVSPKVRARDMIQRREYRRMMFNTYFKEARSQKVSMKGRGYMGLYRHPVDTMRKRDFSLLRATGKALYSRWAWLNFMTPGEGCSRFLLRPLIKRQPCPYGSALSRPSEGEYR